MELRYIPVILATVIDCIAITMSSAAPTELTNLIIISNSSTVEAQGSPTTERTKFSHIQFHMIKYEDLKWVRVTHTGPGLSCSN